MANRQRNFPAYCNANKQARMLMTEPAQDISLIRLHDDVEAAAYRSMYAAAPPELAKSLGLQVQESNGACALMAPAMPTPVFNRVIGLGNREPANADALNSLQALYQAAGIGEWWLHVSPAGQEDVLQQLLVARGFEPAQRRSWAKMYRDASAIAPIDCRAEIREVAAGEESAMAECLCAAYDMPESLVPWFVALGQQQSWRAVAAWIDGSVVGVGFLFVEAGHGWFGAAGVRPEARGLHVHRALMAKRIELARAAGCSGLFTETGEAIAGEPNPSLRNMHACGFKQVCSRLNLLAPQDKN
jgi:GNAT superfamily N-acetyltransferase